VPPVPLAEITVRGFVVREKHCSLAEKVRLTRRHFGGAALAPETSRKKQRFSWLASGPSPVGAENLKNYITEYYKGLFGPHTPNSLFFSQKSPPLY
jgi:hypothetical protein